MVRRFPLFLLLVILSASTLHSQQQDQTPIVEGYVGNDCRRSFHPRSRPGYWHRNIQRREKIEADLLNQSGRVSLGLLNDAGYDIHQAPITWWTLAKDSHGDLATTSLPPRAANLYQSLASTWNHYSEATDSPSTTAATK